MKEEKEYKIFLYLLVHQPLSSPYFDSSAVPAEYLRNPEKSIRNEIKYITNNRRCKKVIGKKLIPP